MSRSYIKVKVVFQRAQEVTATSYYGSCIVRLNDKHHQHTSNVSSVRRREAAEQKRACDKQVMVTLLDIKDDIMLECKYDAH